MKLTLREKREYMACDCWLYITGHTDADQPIPRQTLKTRILDEAVKEARRINAQSVAENATPDDPQGRTIQNAVETFLRAHKNKVSSRVYDHYELTLQRFIDYCTSKSRLYITELDHDFIEDFQTDGLVMIPELTSRETAMSKVKKFLKVAGKRDWTAKNLGADLDSIGAKAQQKQPYTSDEVKLILENAGKMNGGTYGFASKPKTFRLLLELMLQTGMRVSDGVRFEPSKMRQTKTGFYVYKFLPHKSRNAKEKKYVTIWLKPELQKAIAECEWMSKELPFSYTGRLPDDDSRMKQAVYERMKSIGQMCVIQEEKKDKTGKVVQPKKVIDDCRPHRFRDTFAVRMLENGASLDDVCQLLGHSSVAVTEKYYAAWSIDREERLFNLTLGILQTAF
jgi:site-specific recombinase XerD